MPLNANPLFQAVKSHLDQMLEHGRPVVDGEQSPLFAGVIDVGSKQPRLALCPPPPGIRITDFNWCGNNLMHDIPMLEAMNAITSLTGEEQYANAVDDIYAYYVKHCPHPKTGLFPWGEHAQWSFADKAILPCSFNDGLKTFREHDYLIHDHLAHAPAFFWEGMSKHSVEAIRKFAHGLNGHIVDEKTFEHNRHGTLTGAWWRDPKNPDFDMGKDFARHAGFFIFDCLFAYKKSGDESLVDWARKKLMWHWNRRLPNGLISACVRTSTENNEGHHDSFSVSIAEAADVLGRDTAFGAEFGGYADELLEAKRKQQEGAQVLPPEAAYDDRIWITGYMRKHKKVFNLIPGNVTYLVHERNNCPTYAKRLTTAADWLVENLTAPPKGLQVMARTFHVQIDRLIAAYLVDPQPKYLQKARQVADWAIEGLYREGMFLGMSNLNIYSVGVNFEWHFDQWAEPTTPGYYYSITNTPLLVRSLLHIALLEEGEEDILGIDLTQR